MGFVKEFKDFALKGNVMDLAVGVIIGAAFGKIVTSLIEDVITPLLLNPALKAAGVDKIENWAPGGIFWGKFLSAVLTFIVIAFVIFMLVKAMNSMKKKEEAAPSGPSSTDVLLTEIRDALKK
jgi:large conductance mechanosensitive channel